MSIYLQFTIDMGKIKRFLQPTKVLILNDKEYSKKDNTCWFRNANYSNAASCFRATSTQIYKLLFSALKQKIAITNIVDLGRKCASK